MKKLVNRLIGFVLLIGIIVLCAKYVSEPSVPPILLKTHVLQDMYTLAGTKDLAITSLKGGMSGSNLYKVDGKDSSYVIRLLGNCRSTESKAREVLVQTIASQEGWGPKLYASDIDEGWIIMEYIKPTPLTESDRMNDETYISLGQRLQQIHTGPEFLSVRDRLKEIKERLDRLYKENKIPQSIDYEVLKNIIDLVKKHGSTVLAPTHRDLNPNNIIFSNHQPFIIDFEDAAQDDPFYDLGTIGIFYIFNTHHEEVFLKAYFNRVPTQQEYMRYQRMKQLALIAYGLNFLNFAPQEVIANVSVPLEPFEKLLQDFDKGVIDINNSTDQLRLAVSLLQEAINQYRKTVEI